MAYVLEKADNLDGWIYLCPNCKKRVVCGNVCEHCGHDIDLKNKIEYGKSQFSMFEETAVTCDLCKYRESFWCSKVGAVLFQHTKKGLRPHAKCRGKFFESK